LEVLAKYIHKKCILGKIEWRKTPFGVRYNGDKFENLGKIERFFFGGNRIEKKALEAKYNGEKRKGVGKIHTQQMHSGQNTMEKNCIWGKMQRRKA
jgi:hypothetical protein